MKKPIIIFLLIITVFSTTYYLVSGNAGERLQSEPDIQQGCVFTTVFGEVLLDSSLYITVPAEVKASVAKGLEWMQHAQHSNGGWGAGSYFKQSTMNPHDVNTDPATTSMVAMALLRTGNTPYEGRYSQQLKMATEYLISCVKNAPVNSTNITSETQTQIQRKLGENIDVIMTAQFFTNLLEYIKNDTDFTNRVKWCLNVCVRKIEMAQESDGSIRGSGWAGVLQSAFANNALEAAKANGIKVDSVVLERSKNYQKSNLNTSTGDVKTEKGAGIVLYSVSGSTRAAAKDARKVEDEVKKAISSGNLEKNAPVTPETLEKIGFSKTDAIKYSTSYNVYESGKQIAQQDKVISGFGNNGGEEFLSFLQTGESMVINADHEWKKWFSNTSANLLKIQNNDGSWNGHHCITSPVFCTATCLLILSINDDVDKLISLGLN